jgi:hypothetical protein
MAKKAANKKGTMRKKRKEPAAELAGIARQVEWVDVALLKPHPSNYREHPADQIEHIKESIRENGLYRNIVVARENTILAGHGVTIAVREMGVLRVPVVRMDLAPDDPRALKILSGDNEISRLGIIDDRALSEMLKVIKDQSDNGLLGTGWDDMMLANLAFVTRPASEIKNFDAAAEWAGMPEYEQGEETKRLIVTFRTEADRQRFITEKEITTTKSGNQADWTAWWPPREHSDLKSVKFEG